MSSSASYPPPLIHIHTLPSPHGRTRAWSSTPYPSSSTPLLATASADKSVSIWSLRDFRFLSTITGGHKRSVRCVGWKDYGSPSTASNEPRSTGKRKPPVTLATGSFDANVGIWVHNDRSTQQSQDDEPILGAEEEDELPQDQSDEIDISKTENNNDEDEEEWHFSTLLTGPDSEIKSLAFSPPHYSANLLATSSRDKSVWVWEEMEDDEWETIAVLGEHAGDVKCVAWNTGAVMRPESTAGKSEDENESRIIAGRELLASGAYDDTIRLWRDIEEEGDWGCVGVIEGHGGTVWSVKFEGHINYDCIDTEDVNNGEWEPRLLSCSDDLSVRVWRREVSEAEREKKRRLLDGGGTDGPRLPSIIRPVSTMERWVQDAVLPPVHVRSVYAIDWSRKTGLVVSCGGDGTIAVYREVPDLDPNGRREEDGDGDVVMSNGTSGHEHASGHEEQHTDAAVAPLKEEKKKTKWIILYQIDAAHDEYEINHVCWATRLDAGRKSDEEEMIVSTGDDGDVRLWALP